MEERNWRDIGGYWNSDLFDDPESDIYLYELHGSVDWYYNDGRIFKSDEPAEKRLLIFGIDK